MSRIEHVSDDVVVLWDSIALDGRISWRAPDETGLETFNVYVHLTPDRALIIDTSVALFKDSLIDSLAAVVGSRSLGVFVTRMELDCIGNLAAILDRFENVQVATANLLAPIEMVHLAAEASMHPPVKFLRPGDGLDATGFSHLKIIDPVIKTLGTSWIWDTQSSTLFTSDSFCCDRLASTEQSLIRTDEPEREEAAFLRQKILGKFDWLAALAPRTLEERWDTFFAKVKPAVVAPAHGRVQLGHEVAARVVENYRSAIFG